MKNDRFKAKLTALEQLRKAFDSTTAPALLRKGLADPSNFIVAKAAQVIGEAYLTEFVPELMATFSRLLDDCDADPGCRGKEAIARALKDFEHRDPEIFLRGLEHIQFEPVFRMLRADTAGALRGVCAHALVACDIDSAVLLERLTDHLVDSDKAVRLECARAIAQLGRPESGILLRLKALSGDEEAEVTGQCLLSLLDLAAPGAVAFTARFLDAPQEDVQFEAASALALQHSAEALPYLETFWRRELSLDLRRAIVIALGGSPNPKAAAFLLGVVEDYPRDLGATALEALATSRFASDVRERAATIVQKYDLAVLSEAFDAHFAS